MSPEGPRASLRVLVGSGRRGAAAAPGLGMWLAGVAPSGARGTVGVVVVSDRKSRELNRRYLGRDYATDVLSFPASGGDGPLKAPLRDSWLGDIVIARGVARRQAREAGHSERTELRVLALHGLLHLLGYDHDRDRAMLPLERRLRRKGGLPEGLIERARKR